ncbi:MAG TPA: hypothetical protein V6C52_09320 [Coleofasciculaceae cyanobacterium]|jgi:hypothetical protein
MKLSNPALQFAGAYQVKVKLKDGQAFLPGQVNYAYEAAARQLAEAVIGGGTPRRETDYKGYWLDVPLSSDSRLVLVNDALGDHLDIIHNKMREAEQEYPTKDLGPSQKKEMLKKQKQFLRSTRKHLAKVAERHPVTVTVKPVSLAKPFEVVDLQFEEPNA